ncbi:MAG: hypothetical protein FWB90_02115 [Fibromonadales bacterium]|nr:hypothetical protein [Fibromonadales bacterium]
MKKEKQSFAMLGISRKTRRLFDRSFKFIMTRASAPAVVHLINGIYKKNYPPDAVVEVRKPREYITENPESGALGETFTDMVVTLSCGDRKDTYLMEAQIKDDMEMCLRVFNYSVSVALENKVVSEDGTRLQIDMPAPAVIYWETSKTKDFLTIEIRFPGDKSVVYQVPAFKVLEHSVSELGHLALLLPFYLLKVRAELKKSEADSAKRRELAKRLAGYVSEIAEALHMSQENSYITEKDAAMLKERMAKMHSELYGGYKEFTEVDMTLEQMYNTSVLKKIDDAEARVAKVEARAEAKVAKAEKRLEKHFEERLAQVAKAMKTAGDTVSKIMRCTGLSRRKIMAL